MKVFLFLVDVTTDKIKDKFASSVFADILALSRLDDERPQPPICHGNMQVFRFQANAQWHWYVDTGLTRLTQMYCSNGESIGCYVSCASLELRTLTLWRLISGSDVGVGCGS